MGDLRSVGQCGVGRPSHSKTLVQLEGVDGCETFGRFGDAGSAEPRTALVCDGIRRIVAVLDGAGTCSHKVDL